MKRMTYKDSKIYKMVKIGEQEWMAENLNVGHFRNGDPIPEAKTDKKWKSAGHTMKPAWCYYYNDPSIGEKYGKLYNWYAVNDPRGLAPKGWHVPTDEEWITLIDYLGGKDVAGGKMKEAGAPWGYTNKGATNESGFTALLGGERSRFGGFDLIGHRGYWWSDFRGYISLTLSRMWCNFIYMDSLLFSGESKSDGLSVRCLRD